ncbi:MAG: UDP-N-acetylmuramoyl-L-alanine--D-glutamate ligase [Cytophagaceae bacterium]|jgi:UDP-N-acetylmuramoylalanine--D-glutamate ligase|nr:UDP-N-acetylmuramoyl-L-alanine--D-glutamate ligase [Cytophagaceae bacterium]
MWNDKPEDLYEKRFHKLPPVEGNGESIVILGAGESGVGAALLAKTKGFDVFVSDKGTISPKAKLELQQHNIPFEEEQHTMELILCAAEIIKSPGIPESAPVMVAIRESDIPVISEIEFAGRYSNAIKIGITGSNGKTTTTLWIYHIMKRAGMDVILAGNIGTSYARALVERDPKYAVIELSSFQLDDMYNFKCNVAIITNITPDHLDRYNNDFEKYIQSKLRILQNMASSGIFIYDIEDKILQEHWDHKTCYIMALPFSLHHPWMAAWNSYNHIRYRTWGKRFSVHEDDLRLRGKHNICNAMCAGIACLVLGMTKADVIHGLTSFKGVEHRLERVATVSGVTYINDSKATNVDSVWYALDSLKHPDADDKKARRMWNFYGMSKYIVWIVGGTDKGNDYSRLFPLVKEKVKAIICLGADNTKLLETFGTMVPVIEDVHSMDKAVALAAACAEKRDTVLLSPACASFDLFNNYEHRGQLFKQKVNELNIRV